MKITIHQAKDFQQMKLAGALAARTLDYIADYVKPGVTTGELDTLCHQFIVSHGAWPAPLNYHGFPKSICTSINEVVCHGIPGEQVLLEGDIVNIDVTVILDGWHGDTSRTFAVGKIDQQAAKIIDVAYQTMMQGIKVAKPGKRLGDLGYAMQTYAEAQGCSVVKEYCGHGLGKKFHDEPQVMNFGKKNEGVKLLPGMFFTIEPMVNLGKQEVLLLDDGWTVVTADNSLTAQFEHSIGITETGCVLFTDLGSKKRT